MTANKKKKSERERGGTLNAGEVREQIRKNKITRVRWNADATERETHTEVREGHKHTQEKEVPCWVVMAVVEVRRVSGRECVKDRTIKEQ